MCTAAPNTAFKLGDRTRITDATGSAQFGLALNAPSSLQWTAGTATGTLTIAPRTDEYREIPGFDCDKVEARTPEQIAHVTLSLQKKTRAFANFNAGRGALDGFIKPSNAIPSSPFGPKRKYIGVSKVTGEPCEKESIHYGYDMAAPVGTVVVAPADGVVTLADPDLYYEGGAVFIDHGQGILSVLMHLSRVDVAEGAVVKRGAPIALTGNTGRTTGPHLHWAIKWRDSSSATRDGDIYIDPALLLVAE